MMLVLIIFHCRLLQDRLAEADEVGFKCKYKTNPHLNLYERLNYNVDYIYFYKCNSNLC